MTDFTLTLSIASKAEKFALQPTTNVRINTPPTDARFFKSIQFPGDLWHASITFPPLVHQEFYEHEAFWNQLGGKAHRVNIWHLGHPVPSGTKRGNPSLAATATEGSNNILVAGSVGTLLAGDNLGVTLNNGLVQFVQIGSIVSISGDQYTCRLVVPLRWDANSGAAVFWQRPLIKCALASSPFFEYKMITSEGYSVELMEVPR